VKNGIINLQCVIANEVKQSQTQQKEIASLTVVFSR